MSLYAKLALAPLNHNDHVEQIAAGYETDVYRTADRRYVVKLKRVGGSELRAALTSARTMRTTAERFTVHLGPHHSIPNHYVITRSSRDRVQVLVIQPFIDHALPLYVVDYDALNDSDLAHVSTQLWDIVQRSLICYRVTGYIPDLYGLFRPLHIDRGDRDSQGTLPRQLWGLLVPRTLLRSHNLLLTDAPECRVVLVDYDRVCWNWLSCRIIYAIRWVLLWRDYILALLLWRGRVDFKR